MFTVEERDHVRDLVLTLVKADVRVTAGAMTGSSAAGAEDEWSDIDLAFGIDDAFTPETVLNDWTATFTRELGLLHYWDLPSGSAIYRVFLLPSGIEVDLGVFPQRDFGARGPRFRPLFGTSRPPMSPPPPSTRFHIGLAWHHIFHARSSILRGQPWRAEYWISGIRDETFVLACLRLGENASESRGIDCLPPSVTMPLTATLVRSLDDAELRRALAAATACFLSELAATDPLLCARLEPLLREYGAPQSRE